MPILSEAKDLATDTTILFRQADVNRSEEPLGATEDAMSEEVPRAPSNG